MIYKIARTELQTLFYSPIAWLILIVFTIQSVLKFSGSMGSVVNYQELGYTLSNLSISTFADIRGLFASMQQNLYLYIPLLTMGLMSREFSSGSIKLLYSSPVTDNQIILGKYLSMVFYSLILCAILLVFVIFGAFTIENFDFPAVATALLGLFLLVCAYSAIGLFMSSITSYQVVAAIGTFVILFILKRVGIMWQQIELVRDITYWLSMNGRTKEFMRGLICSEDVLYFLIVIALFIAFSIIRLRANRQKTPLGTTIFRFVAVSLIAVSLGYVSSRPMLMVYHDSTRTDVNTLTQNSQDIVSKLKGGLTINSYVNILDELFWIGMPHSELQDRDRFRQYTRFKPEIKMNYIHYYDKANNPSLDKRYPDLSDRQRMLKYADNLRIDSTLFKTPEEIQKIENLLPEENRFVRTLVRESGEKTFLRVFLDAQVHPSEAEISVAMKRLITKLPKVAFVTGHGERDCNSLGDRDYRKFTVEKTFRYSLINQGFDFEEIKLDEPVSEDVDILVIADVRKPFLENHLKNLYDFIDRGGNLLIAGEPDRQEIMNKIVEPFGVKYLPGRVVKSQHNYQPDFVLAAPTKEGAEIMYKLDEMKEADAVITMPGLSALSYTNGSLFNIKELFTVDMSDPSWLELETTNFVDDSVSINPQAGEEIQSNIAAALALERTIPGSGKEQRIVVLGDADCISNAEISISRRNIHAANYNIILGSFFWMSNNEVPIDVRRETPPDGKIFLNPDGMKFSKWAMMVCLPFAMLVIYLLMWIRRRSR